MSAVPGKVMFIRNAQSSSALVDSKVQVRAQGGAVAPFPSKESRLQCVCGGTHFYVTRIDFVCVVCHQSYKD